MNFNVDIQIPAILFSRGTKLKEIFGYMFRRDSNYICKVLIKLFIEYQGRAQRMNGRPRGSVPKWKGAMTIRMETVSITSKLPSLHYTHHKPFQNIFI